MSKLTSNEDYISNKKFLEILNDQVSCNKNKKALVDLKILVKHNEEELAKHNLKNVSLLNNAESQKLGENEKAIVETAKTLNDIINKYFVVLPRKKSSICAIGDTYILKDCPIIELNTPVTLNFQLKKWASKVINQQNALLKAEAKKAKAVAKAQKKKQKKEVKKEAQKLSRTLERSVNGK